MPFVPNETSQNIHDKFVSPEIEEQDFTFGEKVQAAWHVDNWIGSKLFEEEMPKAYAPDPEYNPLDSLTETELRDDAFLDEVIYLETPEQLEWARRQRGREMAEREKLTGFDGFLASFVGAGLTDPLSYLGPGGAAYRSYKVGESLLKGGVTTGLVTAGVMTVQEALLHESQVTRTYGESAMNITAGTFLGTVLGGGAAALGASQRKTLANEIDDILRVPDTEAARQRNISAAETLGEIEIKGTLSRKLAEAFPYNPLIRGLTSQSQATRKATVQLAENPVDVDGFTGQALESRVKIRRDGMLTRALYKHREQYKLYRKAGGKLKLKQYNELVSKEIRNPGAVDDPNIKQSAAAFNEEIYSKTLADMQEQGLLPEDMDPKTAQEYLNRRWNREKLAANFPEFVARTKGWLKEQYDIKADIQAKVDDLDEVFKKADTPEATRAALKEMEDLLKDLPSPIANKVRARAKARKAEDGPKKMYKSLKDAIAKTKAADYEGMLDDVELERLATEIGNRILGSPDGMLPYSYKIGDHADASGAVTNTLRGPFKARTFMIPDHMVADFLDNDIEELAGVYLRQTAADIEIVKMFGDPKTPVEETIQMNDFIRNIQDDYAEMIKKAPDEATRSKLLKKRDRDIRDFAGMRDRIRGVYKMPDPNDMSHRIMTAARNINFLRLMGGVAVSSFPDMARLVMSEGIVKTFGTLMRPMIKGIKGNKPAADDVKYWGIGTDAITGGRLEIISDINDYALGGTKFERGLQTMANGFGNINMMNQWTGLMKRTHAISMQARVMDELVAGKINKNLKRLGISDADAMQIKDQVLKWGEKDGNAWIFNAENWDNPELALKWGSALRKESDRVIVVPGQEKPLFMSSEAGKTIFQFQSFMMSATQRVTMAALQRQDEHLISGVMAMVTFGAMTYAYKQWEAGREISDDPRVWVAEGLDRSGALGIMMEANNTLEKVTNNRFGLRPLMGIAAPASRYASRNMSESLAGPTFGSALSTTLQILGATTSEREWSESDTAALRRMLPYQNLTGFRIGINKIQEQVNEAIGAK